MALSREVWGNSLRNWIINAGFSIRKLRSQPCIKRFSLGLASAVSRSRDAAAWVSSGISRGWFTGGGSRRPRGYSRGVMQVGRSLEGLLTRVLTGWAIIASAGYGRRSGCRAAGSWMAGSSHRA